MQQLNKKINTKGKIINLEKKEKICTKLKCNEWNMQINKMKDKKNEKGKKWVRKEWGKN